MSRERWIWDRELQCLVQIGEGSNRETPAPSGKSAYVIGDIAPYRAAGSDIAAGGKRPVIGGRRQHREFLKRNGYVEVGNERRMPERVELPRGERVADIKRAIERHS